MKWKESEKIFYFKWVFIKYFFFYNKIWVNEYSNGYEEIKKKVLCITVVEKYLGIFI